ncbi:MAG TPA: nuclear transport factor 2 family protein [Gemmatimonadaceae bacterium]|nr:nuclear transport factor 2 family protein [Gemmatimonadaceae bacterium]
MRYRSQSLLILSSVFLACGCTPHARPRVEIARAASLDQASLLAAAQHFLRVFDNMEWEPFRAAWSRNPTAFLPGDTPDRIEGSAVLARFQEFFIRMRSSQSGPPYLHLAPRSLRAETFGSAGVVTFMLGDRPGNINRRTLVFVLEDGEWKLAHLHGSVVRPPEP